PKRLLQAFTSMVKVMAHFATPKMCVWKHPDWCDSVAVDQQLGQTKRG
ncbi:peptidase, partial [Xanthomonas oryzae pv. oryzae]